MRTNRGVVGPSPLPPRPRDFARALRFLRPPSAPSFDEVSSSRELSASSRVLRPARCPSCLIEPHEEIQSDRPKSASHGVLSLIAASASGVYHSPGNPDPEVTFRPRRFSRPRRFAPPPAFAGLFHPAATSRVCPSGVCPSHGAVPGFPGRFMPSCRWTRPPLTSKRVPDFRALSPRGECGVDRDGLGPDSIRAPPGLPAPPGTPSAHRGDAFTSPPPTAFTAKNPSQLAPGVSPIRGLACLEPGCRPARAFRPEPPASFRKSGSRSTFQATHREIGRAHV